MRKSFVVMLLAFAGLMGMSGQAHGQGRLIIDVYHGFPNMWSNAVRSAIDQSFVSNDVQTNSIGPWGARAELMVTRKIGIGVDLLYANSGVNFSGSPTDNNSDGDTYNYSVRIRRARRMGRLNYHLIGARRIDPYLALGIGYSGNNVSVETNDPLLTVQDLNLPFNLPIAGRAAVGMRLFLTKNIGVGAELGLGGPLVTGGLSLKI